MKKKSVAIALIMTVLLVMFSSIAVLAEDDDHGADAHSDSMSQIEEDVLEEEELSFTEEIINAVTSYIPYIIGAVCGIILIVIIVKAVGRSRKPKYTGKH
jgi:hypothetical protein